MAQATDSTTTDPSEPTTAQMDDMWILARARELEDEAHRRSIIIQRRAAMAIVGEAA